MVIVLRNAQLIKDVLTCVVLDKSTVITQINTETGNTISSVIQNADIACIAEDIAQ